MPSQRVKKYSATEKILVAKIPQKQGKKETTYSCLPEAYEGGRRRQRRRWWRREHASKSEERHTKKETHREREKRLRGMRFLGFSELLKP